MPERRFYTWRPELPTIGGYPGPDDGVASRTARRAQGCWTRP